MTLENLLSLTREEAGCLIWTRSLDTSGYGHLRHKGRLVTAHRLAWTLAHGRPIPNGAHIDHVCHRPACINPDHLRAVNRCENLRNRKGAPSTSSTGVRGVRWRDDVGKYQARLAVDGKEHSVGWFPTLDEARDAVIAARAEFYGEFAGGA